MKVKVTKATKSSYWYSRHIGEVFDAIELNRDAVFGDAYRVYVGAGIGYIAHDDCILFNDEEDILHQIAELQKKLDDIRKPKYSINVKLTEQQAKDMLETWDNDAPLAKWLQPIAKQIIDAVKRINNLEV